MFDGIAFAYKTCWTKCDEFMFAKYSLQITIKWTNQHLKKKFHNLTFSDVKSYWGFKVIFKYQKDCWKLSIRRLRAAVRWLG